MSPTDALTSGPEPLSDGQLVRVHGDVDYSRAPELRTKLLQVLKDNPTRLVIDLGDVSYMDSSGIATLVEAMGVQRKSNNKLVLCALQPRVRNILEIARLDSVFEIRDSNADAGD